MNLDLILGKLGRYKRSSGTNDPKLHADVKAMLRMLRSNRRWDVLSLLVNKHVTPLDLYDAFVSGKLDALPSPESLRGFQSSVDRWLETLDRSPTTRKQYGYLLGKFPAKTLSQVPLVLEDERNKAIRSGRREGFNGLRVALRHLMRWAVTPSHALYQAVELVKPLGVRRRQGNPLEVDEVRQLAADMDPMGGMVWDLCVTGMRRTEYFGRRFEVRADRIVVQGVKARWPEVAKSRVVFKAYPITGPIRSYDHFRQRLSDVANRQVRVHDFRYTFTRWASDAGIPEPRLKWYLGHAASHVTETYQRGRGFQAYLSGDAQRFREWIGDGPKQALEVVR